jgi:hypothetical protein
LRSKVAERDKVLGAFRGDVMASGKLVGEYQQTVAPLKRGADFVATVLWLLKIAGSCERTKRQRRLFLRIYRRADARRSCLDLL